MTQTQLYDAISNALYNLSQVNEMIYGYWLTELYDENDKMITSQWTEDTLKMMENDVMNQTLA